MPFCLCKPFSYTATPGIVRIRKMRKFMKEEEGERGRGTTRQAADREVKKTFARQEKKSEKRPNRRPMEMGRSSLPWKVGRLLP